MTVSIIIVNWNGAHLLPACLDSLRTQSRPADEVIVVDNASRDHSLALLRERYPWVKVLPLRTNTGLAGGTNAGIAISKGSLVVTLNNDTIASPIWLEALCRPFDTAPHLGSTMSTMLFAHAPTRIASAGLLVYRNGLIVDDLAAQLHIDTPQPPRPIFGPSAGAAAYRRAMLHDIAEFDEDFFMYLEDADLGWRARLRGWDSLHIPEATILHIYSASSGQGSPFKQYHLARNRIWCLRKNLPRELARAHWPAIIGYDLGALAYSLFQRHPASIRGRLAGLQGGRIIAKRRMTQERRTATLDSLAAWLQPQPTLHEILALQRTVTELSISRTQEAP